MSTFLERAEDPAGVALGRWLGRREAFATIAGRCSAAEAQSLREIRDAKAYKTVAPSWEEFCAKHVGVSRRQVDRTLRLLDEFGPAYFHVAQMAHVTPDEYRAIAPHVGEDGVRVDGAVVALLPENGDQVSAAVAELLRRQQPNSSKPVAASPAAMAKRCDALRESILALDGVDDPGRLQLVAAIYRLIEAARARGLCVFS